MTEEAQVEVSTNPDSDFASNGRYIPYSGGTAGWFENSGVLNCQKENNYQFFSVWDSEEVRQKQYHRMGSSFNRRTAKDRSKVRIPIRISWGRGKNKRSWEGTSRDVSLEGMRLQFKEELGINKGDIFKLDLLKREGGDPQLELEATIIWSELVGRTRPVFNMGVQFHNMKKEKSIKLKEMIEE